MSSVFTRLSNIFRIKENKVGSKDKTLNHNTTKKRKQFRFDESRNVSYSPPSPNSTGSPTTNVTQPVHIQSSKPSLKYNNPHKSQAQKVSYPFIAKHQTFDTSAELLKHMSLMSTNLTNEYPYEKKARMDTLNKGFIARRNTLKNINKIYKSKQNKKSNTGSNKKSKTGNNKKSK
jgi:hypothetical protein